jgi:hypothetical protein
MRFYSGASLIVDDNGIADGTVLAMVNCLEGCYSFDSDNQNDAAPVGTGTDMYLLVSETLPGGGTAYIGGSAFMSDFESAYDNPVLAEAMLKSMTASDAAITYISDVRNANIGDAFTIEGIVTTATYGAQPSLYFAYTMYIQDETGGIAIYPINNNPFEAGQRVRVTGKLDAYQGDLELVIEDEYADVILIDDAINPVAPLTLSTADSMKAEYQGMFVRTQGVVTGVVNADGAITDIYLEDESGVESHIYINGYVGYSEYGAYIEEFVRTGAEISVAGIASEGFDGYRLRVRDRSEITLIETKEPVFVSFTATPSSANLQDKTTITITIKGYYADGTGGAALASASVKLKQSGTQTVKVGDHDVTVVVNGNNKITECYVGVPASGGGNQNGNSQNGNSQGQNSNSQGKGNQQ